MKLFDRVLEEMAACKRIKVQPVYTKQGVFVNATLREQTEYFLTRALRNAKRAGKRYQNETNTSKY